MHTYQHTYRNNLKYNKILKIKLSAVCNWEALNWAPSPWDLQTIGLNQGNRHIDFYCSLNVITSPLQFLVTCLIICDPIEVKKGTHCNHLIHLVLEVNTPPSHWLLGKRVLCSDRDTCFSQRRNWCQYHSNIQNFTDVNHSCSYIQIPFDKVTISI